MSSSFLCSRCERCCLQLWRARADDTGVQQRRVAGDAALKLAICTSSPLALMGVAVRGKMIANVTRSWSFCVSRNDAP